MKYRGIKPRGIIIIVVGINNIVVNSGVLKGGGQILFHHRKKIWKYGLVPLCVSSIGQRIVVLNVNNSKEHQ